jgi:predicted O-methyltransferase YrrM
MEFIDPQLSQYSADHTSPESKLLQRINRETNLEVLMPRMLSGHLQGRILAMVAKMVNPKYIVEIGTYTGYSALCMAEGLQKDGKLITIDLNEELQNRVLGYFKESIYDQQLDFRIGDAAKILPTLSPGIDLVFIDADKVNYLKYYNIVIDKLNAGGYILVDNVLWSGKVVDKVQPDDATTLALKKFNAFIQQDERVENVLMPVRDGLMLIRKK